MCLNLGCNTNWFYNDRISAMKKSNRKWCDKHFKTCSLKKIIFFHFWLPPFLRTGTKFEFFCFVLFWCFYCWQCNINSGSEHLQYLRKTSDRAEDIRISKTKISTISFSVCDKWSKLYFTLRKKPSY